MEVKLIDLIKARRAEAPSRHFLKVPYTNNEARALKLREVLRQEEIAKLHPDPNTAAAIMVCDKFSPQWQAWICNFSQAAKELVIEDALQDHLEDCGCRRPLKAAPP